MMLSTSCCSLGGSGGCVAEALFCLRALAAVPKSGEWSVEVWLRDEKIGPGVPEPACFFLAGRGTGTRSVERVCVFVFVVPWLQWQVLQDFFPIFGDRFRFSVLTASWIQVETFFRVR